MKGVGAVLDVLWDKSLKPRAFYLRQRNIVVS